VSSLFCSSAKRCLRALGYLRHANTLRRQHARCFLMSSLLGW